MSTVKGRMCCFPAGLGRLLGLTQWVDLWLSWHSGWHRQAHEELGRRELMYVWDSSRLHKTMPLGPPAVVTVLSLSYLVTMVYALRAHTGILSPCFLLLPSWCWRHKGDPVGYWEASILVSKERCPTSSFPRWVRRMRKLCQWPSIALINTPKWL